MGKSIITCLFFKFLNNKEISMFNEDTSTQGGTPSFVSTTYNTKENPNIKMKTKCGIYNSGDNVIKIFTNNIDALTIMKIKKLFVMVH